MAKIGITKLTNIWYNILNQLGLQYSEVKDIEDYFKFSCIIINSDISNSKDKLLSYLNSGGAIIDNTGFLCSHLNFKTKQIFKSNEIFNSDIYKGLIDIHSKIQQISKDKTNNWNTISIEPINNGLLAFLGLPIDKLLSNCESKRYKFLSNKPKHPEEEVSKISKGPIIRILFNLLKNIHLERNIPFYHKWFFPSSEQNIFLFREDTDYCKEKDITQIQEIAVSNKTNITWFVHVKENLNFLSRYKNSKNDEIAIHCFDHATTNKKDILYNDIDKAISELNKIDISPSGYAAPYGIWNKNVCKTIKDKALLYSSEFSLLYDSLPMNLPCKNSALQVSVHPICIDALLKSGKTDNEIIIYYKKIIDNYLNQQIPIALYDHPGHGHYNILNEIFRYVKYRNIKSITFNKYAEWWKERTKASFTVNTNNYPNVEINTKHHISICFWINKDTYCLSEKSENIDSLEKIKVNNNIDIEIDKIKCTRKFDLNLIKRSLLAKLFWRNKK